MRAPANNEMQLTRGALGGVRLRARIVIVAPLAADLGVRRTPRHRMENCTMGVSGGRVLWGLALLGIGVVVLTWTIRGSVTSVRWEWLSDAACPVSVRAAMLIALVS